MVDQAMELVDLVRRTLSAKGLPGLLQPLPDPIERWLGVRYQTWLSRPTAAAAQLQTWLRSGWAMNAVGNVLSTTSRLLFALLMMLIAMFFLLRDGAQLVRWLEGSLPLAARDVDELLDELRSASRSVIGGNIVTGSAQAAVATVGYFIARVPNPIFVGLLTFISAFIPSLGTTIVGLPTVALLLLLGKTGWAVFLAVWMLVVVGLIDNLLRPLLMRGRANLHGALVFFSLMGGIFVFGAVGLIAGPLALVFFLATTSLLRRRGASQAPH